MVIEVATSGLANECCPALLKVNMQDEVWATALACVVLTSYRLWRAGR